MLNYKLLSCVLARFNFKLFVRNVKLSPYLTFNWKTIHFYTSKISLFCLHNIGLELKVSQVMRRVWHWSWTCIFAVVHTSGREAAQPRRKTGMCWTMLEFCQLSGLRALPNVWKSPWLPVLIFVYIKVQCISWVGFPGTLQFYNKTLSSAEASFIANNSLITILCISVLPRFKRIIIFLRYKSTVPWLTTSEKILVAKRNVEGVFFKANSKNKINRFAEPNWVDSLNFEVIDWQTAGYAGAAIRN